MTIVAPESSSTRRAYMFLGMSLAVGAVAFTFVKVALEELSPMNLAAGRVVTSALAYVAIVLAQPHRRTPLQRRDRFLVLAQGFGGSAGFHVLFQVGLQHSTVAVAAVVMATFPVLVAAGEVMFLDHRLQRHHVIGLLLTVGGCSVIGLASGNDGSSTWWGVLAIGSSTLVWAAVTVASRSVAHRYDSWWLSTPGTVLGAVAMLALQSPHLGQFADLSLRGWLLVVWLGVASSAFVYFAYNRALSVIPATSVSAISTVVTPTSVMVAWLVLGDSPTLVEVLAGVVVLGGVVLSTRPDRAI